MEKDQTDIVLNTEKWVVMLNRMVDNRATSSESRKQG
jgi:hypothetical protein